MEHFSSAFYLTILGLACIAAAPLFLFQKHESVFLCSSSLVIARTLDPNYRTGRAEGSIAMRTFFESIEGKMRNELASAIDYRMLSVCFIHLFRNRKIVHKENLIGNLSLPVSLILFDVEKPRPTSFLAGRVDTLRVLRNTESSLRSRVHNFSLRKHLFGKYLFLSRSQSCAGLVFKKMESLFCSDDPDFYPSFPSSKGFRLRIKSVLLRLISFVSHFSYDKGRKQSTQSRHCSTEKIYRSWEFCPDEKQTKEDKTCAYQQPFYQCCFHLDFLRGLDRKLSLQTKFYSYPRRPLFLGALGKARALLAPRACLKTMLLQAFTSRFIAWSQYLCIAKFSSHLFRTRSGRIGQRRCFLFLRAADCQKMIGENGGTKC